MKTEFWPIRKEIFVGGVLSSFSISSIFCIGLSCFVFSVGFYDYADMSVGIGEVVTDIVSTSSFLYKNPNLSVVPLTYNSKGFVRDEMVVDTGHLVFYLVFNAPAYLNSYGLDADEIGFSFKLGYITSQSTSYTLISNNLTSLSYSIMTSACATTEKTFSSDLADVETNDDLSIGEDDDGCYYLTLDYSFGVGDSFSSLVTDELTKMEGLRLTMGVVS